MTMPATEAAPAVDGDQLCAVCPHPRDTHDRIANRYCSATIAAGGAPRGCVCAITQKTGKPHG